MVNDSRVYTTHIRFSTPALSSVLYVSTTHSIPPLGTRSPSNLEVVGFRGHESVWVMTQSGDGEWCV